MLNNVGDAVEIIGQIESRDAICKIILTDSYLMRLFSIFLCEVFTLETK